MFRFVNGSAKHAQLGPASLSAHPSRNSGHGDIVVIQPKLNSPTFGNSPFPVSSSRA
jgi:hypothetical protein